MEKYLDLDGDSGVDAYEIGDGFIRVRFKDNSVYLYTDESTGSENILKMQELAEHGDGLNSFINKKIRKNYALKGVYSRKSIRLMRS